MSRHNFRETQLVIILKFFLPALLGPHCPMAYRSIGLSVGLNLSLAMIQADLNLAASIGTDYCCENCPIAQPCASLTKP
jgi:hypothetical protein